MKSIYFLFIISLLFFSCEKKGTITGTLVDACGTPLFNHRVNLLKQGGGKMVEYVYTDINGFFIIPYKSKSGSFDLETYSSNDFKIIIKDIPAKNHIDFNEINTEVIYDLSIKLQVNNAYTSSDTLKIDIEGGLQPVHFDIPGPFSNGIVESVMNQTLGNYPYKYNEKPHVVCRYTFTKFPKEFKMDKDIRSCSNNVILFIID